MFLCQNMNEKHQYGVDTLKNIPSCTISSWIHRKYQSLFINSQRLKPEGGRPPCQISTCNALICLKHVCMNHWIRSGQKHGKVCGLSVESKWHGWSVRQGREGEGDSYSRLLREIQNLLHELWKFLHSLLSQIFIGKLLLKMGKLWIFESCETPVAWLGTTQPRAVPVAEPVFFRGTRRLAPFSGKDFSTSRPLLHY